MGNRFFRWISAKRKGDILEPGYIGSDGGETMPNGGLWKIAGMVFAAGMLYSQLKMIPMIAERVQAHETRLSVVEANMAEIRIGLSRILDKMERTK